MEDSVQPDAKSDKTKIIPTRNKFKFTKKQIFLFLTCLFLILTLGTGIYLLNQQGFKNNSKLATSSAEKQGAEQVETRKGLITTFPNAKDLRSLYIDNDGIFWIASRTGLIKYDQKSNKILKIYQEKDGLPATAGVSITGSGADLWYGSAYGVSRLNIKTEKFENFVSTNDIFKEPQDFSGLINNGNLYVVLDPNGKDLWVGTFQGVSKYDFQAKKWTNYLQEYESKIGDTVNGKIVVDEKSVWIGTNQNSVGPGGTAVLDKATGTWTVYNRVQMGINQEDVFSIALSPKTFLVSTFRNKLAKFDREQKRWSVFSELNPHLEPDSYFQNIYYVAPYFLVQTGKGSLLLYNETTNEVKKIEAYGMTTGVGQNIFHRDGKIWSLVNDKLISFDLTSLKFSEPVTIEKVPTENKIVGNTKSNLIVFNQGVAGEFSPSGSFIKYEGAKELDNYNALVYEDTKIVFYGPINCEGFCLDGKVFIYDKTKKTSKEILVKAKDGETITPISKAFLDGKTLWLLGYSQLIELNLETSEIIVHEPPKASVGSHFTKLVADSSSLWLQSNKNLFKFDRTKKVFQVFSPTSGINIESAVGGLLEGKFYFIKEKELVIFNTSDSKWITKQHSISRPYLLSETNGGVWVVSEDVLYKIDAKTETLINVFPTKEIFYPGDIHYTYELVQVGQFLWLSNFYGLYKINP